ncbi:Outer membrane protein C [Candidatus Erwinia haradaeae]|uniref:Outer membrane protein C n=1 Tax=Candidatus Erwinia haradaeae TaxID=1922217 RepID=A0A451DC44_9GAMM|nr:porin [Candidatus Erwinia haradaeae]VFP83988.1 Outer membrane protein C [Candidatus Erwinia haradaeae]
MMHRKIIALMLPALLGTSSVHAAEIYKKDGNTLNLYGKMDLNHQVANNFQDEGEKSRIRVGFRGETQIRDLLTGYGQLEYSIQNKKSDAENDYTAQPSIGFAGLKFSNYGTFDYGKNYGVGYDPLAWTNTIPASGGNYTRPGHGLIGRSNDLVTYRNSNLFGLIDGLDFALQYQGKNHSQTEKKDINAESGNGLGGSFSYKTPTGVAVSAAYTRSDRTNNQKDAYFGKGNTTAETWSTAIKYNANNIYLATMYGETRNNTYIKNKVDDKAYDGMVDREKKFEAVAQYQFDFGLRPSLAYIQSIGKKITHFNNQDLYKYIDLATYYNFNTNLVTYIDYKINLVKKNNFTTNAGFSTNNTVGLGLIYKF